MSAAVRDRARVRHTRPAFRCHVGVTRSSATTTCCRSSLRPSASSSRSGSATTASPIWSWSHSCRDQPDRGSPGSLHRLPGSAGLALVGRPLAIEHRYGLDRVFIWHRILGETMAVLIGLHVVAGVFAWGLEIWVRAGDHRSHRT